MAFTVFGTPDLNKEPDKDKGSGDFTRGCLVVVFVLGGIALIGIISNNSGKPKSWQPRPVPAPSQQSQPSQSYPDPNKVLKASDKIRDWKNAPEVEQLALCVGFAVVSNRGRQLQLSATDFHNCIEEATRGLSQADDLTIMDMARLCEAEMRK